MTQMQWGQVGDKGDGAAAFLCCLWKLGDTCRLDPQEMKTDVCTEVPSRAVHDCQEMAVPHVPRHVPGDG